LQSPGRDIACRADRFCHSWSDQRCRWKAPSNWRRKPPCKANSRASDQPPCGRGAAPDAEYYGMLAAHAWAGTAMSRTPYPFDRRTDPTPEYARGVC
jgi:hypothetical protein